jgi:putative ABC transport system substrate-binding protein
VTGFTSFREDLIGKQMQLLRETVPQIKRLAVIYSSSAPLGLDALKAGAEGLNVNVSLHDTDTGLDNVLHAIEREKPGGLHVLLTASAFRNRVRIAEFALARRLPSVYGIAAHVEAGGLMSYSFNYSDAFRRAAEYVDRILKGAKPSELPVQMSTKFEMAINLKTAKALGLTIPQSVLQRADRLIE